MMYLVVNANAVGDPWTNKECFGTLEECGAYADQMHELTGQTYYVLEADGGEEE